MSRNRHKRKWRNRRTEKGEASIQKMSWKVVKVYSTFEEAEAHRNELKKTKPAKVHRRGVGGFLFAIKVGTPFKKVENRDQA